MTARELLSWVGDRLAERFGEPAAHSESAVETLVRTVLSQNTNDVNRDRAYRELRAQFPDLAAVADADENAVAQVIRSAGLHRQKARTLVGVLSRIRDEQGALDLGFLADLTTEDGLRWLTSSRGVGKKTAGIVLLFCFDKPYFPVDTHIRRICTRLGLLTPGDDAHDRINPLVSTEARTLRALHLSLIRLGREICHPRAPACDRCPLAERCAAAIQLAGQAAKEGVGS
ncbi:MAG: endonuclease III [Candidatus Bipolaricaulota bacterium]|nr:MAG: endonuclease III [Candidatus Bipolaricaulota bacterium]